MNITGAEALQPVLEFLDWLIAEHGHRLYLGLVYVSIPLVAWVLGGGRRRKPSRPVSAMPITIIVFRPSTRPPPLPPPLLGDERDPFADDDEDSFAA
jgi:hypothetical protein